MKENKKILVTGANGFLGSHLCRELSGKGYDVRAMVRPGARLDNIVDISCEVVYGRIDHPDEVDQAVEGCSFVIHAAAITDQWSVPYDAYERVNFHGTRHVAEACLRFGVKKLVHVSTSNVFGPGGPTDPATELDGFTLFSARSAYITTKYLAQQYILEQVEQKKLPAVVVNPTFMIGPRDVKPSSGKLLLYALKTQVLFYPPGGKNFVDVQDVCAGIINALDRGRIGDCYLLAGTNLSYKEFFRLTQTVSGKKRPVMVAVPGFLLHAAATFAGLLGRLTGRQYTINFSVAYLSCKKVFYSGQKSERELAVRYTPVAEAVQKAVTWFQTNDYCK